MYRILVRAVNDYGVGPWSAAYNVTSAVTSKPEPVTGVQVLRSTDSALSIGWSLPSLEGNQGEQSTPPFCNHLDDIFIPIALISSCVAIYLVCHDRNIEPIVFVV